MGGVTFNISPKPDMRVIKRQFVRNTVGNWQKIYTRTYPFIHSIELRSLDTANILYISEDENPTSNDYDELGPMAFVTEGYDPPELFANTSAGDIFCLVIVEYFSINYMKRMAMGIMEPMPRNPKPGKDEKGQELDPLTQYYYRSDKALGRVKGG